MLMMSSAVLFVLIMIIMFSQVGISSFFCINHLRHSIWVPLKVSVCLFYLLVVCLIFPRSSFANSNMKDYIIGHQDVLKIEVWDNPDLSREVTVSLTDTIFFPLIGEVRVEGHTAEELQRIIRSRLADGYLVNPQVTVTVKEYNSKKVYMLGEVNKPGYYPFSKVTTMVEIISMAGGLTPDAGEEAYILRSPKKINLDDVKRLIDKRKHNLPLETSVDGFGSSIDGLSSSIGSSSDSPDGGSVDTGDSADRSKSQVITINLDDFSQGVNLSFELQNNDTLYIPKAKFFYMIGEVKSPGRFKLEKEINILQAISMAGGLTQKANENKTKIIRTVDGKDQEIKAKMTDFVFPDDIIKIPESFF